MFKIITKPSTLTNLLETLITNPHPQTLVIICMSRSDFVTRIQAEILSSSLSQHQRPEEIPASQDEDGEPIDLESDLEARARARAEAEAGRDVDMTTDINVDSDTTTTTNKTTTTTHGLLIPTLHLLGASENVRLAFCSSINSLRAYVASYSPVRNHQQLNPNDNHNISPPSSSHPTKLQTLRIIILNALSLHTDTSEFSMQGLNQTFASIVSMAWRLQAEIRLVESDEGGEGGGYGEKWPWDVEVPLLSVGAASGVAARPGGVGSWAGRRVRMRDALGRWFEFE